MWSMAYRAARLGVAAVLMSSLSGCLWLALTETTDNRTYRYDGTVTRAGGTPVANARVEITDGFEFYRQGPPPPGAGVCSGEIGGMVHFVTTDAQGKYLYEDRREDENRGFCLSVRVIPAPGSGLAEAVVQGEAYRFEQPVSRESLTHRRVDVVLPAAP
ncbi:MAG: hypothetical protein AVDCRST_MAG68-4149 [uncultured Gemmatimonadetes bacterium]|uniref:Lipoprotein n=1 Tax=uncultured Gemmatimonadota bacterium TaxID=203437 RepID=A0A6J4MEW5_9BACT|nr:MAG: hypothetical protein AVDCRST_MAG68-4149 [uncultured Gemmatimonadota bacterium]